MKRALAVLYFCLLVVLSSTVVFAADPPRISMVPPDGSTVINRLGEVSSFTAVTDGSLTDVKMLLDGSQIGITAAESLLSIGQSTDYPSAGKLFRMGPTVGKDLFAGKHTVTVTGNIVAPGTDFDGKQFTVTANYEVFVTLDPTALYNSNSKVQCQGRTSSHGMGPEYATTFNAYGGVDGSEYHWALTDGVVYNVFGSSTLAAIMAQFTAPGQKYLVVENGGAYGLCRFYNSIPGGNPGPVDERSR